MELICDLFVIQTFIAAQPENLLFLRRQFCEGFLYKLVAFLFKEIFLRGILKLTYTLPDMLTKRSVLCDLSKLIDRLVASYSKNIMFGLFNRNECFTTRPYLQKSLLHQFIGRFVRLKHTEREVVQPRLIHAEEQLKCFFVTTGNAGKQFLFAM